MDEDKLRALGLAVRRMRRDRDLSQEALAGLARVHPNQVGRLERSGHVHATTLLGVLDALGVPLLAAVRAYDAQHGPRARW